MTVRTALARILHATCPCAGQPYPTAPSPEDAATAGPSTEAPVPTNPLARWFGRLVTANVEVDSGVDGYDVWQEEVVRPAEPDNAMYMTSRLRGTDMHLPVLDIDVNAQLIESKTVGHHHLIIDKPMTWRQYKRLLRALARAGVVEKSWAKATIAGGQTLLAIPRVADDR